MQNHSAERTVSRRRVVDAFTRTLHALMAISFGLAYVTSEVDALRLVHVTMGYTLGVVFLLRLIWGVLGPRRVSLSVLGGRLAGIRQVLDVIRRCAWQEWLKIVLALSVVTLLLCVLPVVTSGYVTYFEFFGEWSEDVHESLANLMVLAVSGHVVAVVLLSWGQSVRQVRPMITGCIEGQGPDLIQHNLVLVAVALLLMVTGFWSWQAYQYAVDPQLIQQPRWLHPEGGYEPNRED